MNEINGWNGKKMKSWLDWLKEKKMDGMLNERWMKDEWKMKWKDNEKMKSLWKDDGKMNVNHENLDGMINEKMNGMLNNLITR